MNSPNTPDDPQDKTQLTAGGSPGALEFRQGDIVGGDYQVTGFIGAGGMGDVYRVRHTLMQAEYALKTLSAEKVTEVAWLRFHNEAQAIARMNHPNVVAIYNLGLHDGHLPYYVMELIEGTSLADKLKETGAMPVNEALALFLEVCAGLGYAHKKGIVHRDIKPGNIIVLEKPIAAGARVKIVDFGIAKLSYSKQLEQQQLTGIGEICGSPYYMSPEQCAAEKIDARSDVYSLGCTMFEALTGSTPFKGRNAVETMMLHSTSPAPSLQAGGAGGEFPHQLEMVLAKMLAKAPMDRYQTVDQIAQDLTEIIAGPKKLADNQLQLAEAKQNRRLLVAAVAGILLLLAGTWYWSINGLNRIGPTSSTEKEATIKAPLIKLATDLGPLMPPLAVSSGKIDTTTPLWAPVKRPDGKTYMHFIVPEHQGFGKISGLADKHDTFETGPFELPYGCVSFTPAEGCIAHPEYLARFGPNVLSSLVIDNVAATCPIDNRIFRYLVGLKGLRSLSLKGLEDINDDAMNYIELIPDLDCLVIDDSHISMTRLARSPLLQRISWLRLIRIEEPLLPVLQSLKNSTRMVLLELPGTTITNDEYKALADLSSVRNLNLNANGVSDQNLKAMLGKLHLKVLQATENRLTAASIPTMKKLVTFTQGSWVDLSSKNMSEQDCRQLVKALPALTITCKERR